MTVQEPAESGAPSPRQRARVRPLLKRVAAAWERVPGLRLVELLWAANGQQEPYGLDDDVLVEKVVGYAMAAEPPLESPGPPAPCTHCLSPHALRRYREFYPHVEDEDGVWQAILAAEAINPHVAQRLAGRRRTLDANAGGFWLHAERTGVFVVVEQCVVTFLRFYSSAQHDLARRLYGDGETVTAEGPPYASELRADIQGLTPQRVGDDGTVAPLFLGRCPDQITFSGQAAKVLGGRRKAGRLLPTLQTRMLTSAELERLERNLTQPDVRPISMVVADNARLVVSERSSGALHITVAPVMVDPSATKPKGAVREVSPSAPHIDWLGISAAELQVSPAAARVTSNASKRAKKKAFGQVRRALIERPGVLEEVPSGWRVCVAVAGDERVFWVVRSWGSSRSWWVLAQPPEEPPPELLLAARSLLDAGWRVEPPFWKAGLWAAPPPAPPAAAPPEDVP